MFAAAVIRRKRRKKKSRAGNHLLPTTTFPKKQPLFFANPAYRGNLNERRFVAKNRTDKNSKNKN